MTIQDTSIIFIVRYKLIFFYNPFNVFLRYKFGETNKKY